MSSVCDGVREALPWFVGGDLEPARGEEVREHLLGCMNCRSAASALQQNVARLQRAATVPLPGVDADFFAQLHRTIVHEVAAVERTTPEHGVVAGRASMPKRAHVRIALAAVLLVGLGFWLGRGPADWGSVFDRSPLVTPATFDGPAKVVPYGRDGQVPQRFLNSESTEPFDGAVEPLPGVDGAGMRGRSELRTLVSDRIILPPR